MTRLYSLLLFSLFLPVFSVQASPAIDPCMLPADSQSVALPAAPAGGRTLDQHILRQIALSAHDRVQILCDIRQAVALQYSGIDIKRERLNLDVAMEISDCARAELGESDGNRLKFVERVQACLARLKDSHFAAQTLVPIPAVFTLVESRLLNGKVYISSINRKLIRLTQQRTGNPDMEALLAPGAEIVEVDGVPAVEALERLVPHISASSDAVARYYAGAGLLQRSFSFPEKSFVELKIKPYKGDAVTIRLPWVSISNDRSLMPEAAQVLRDAGIPFINDIGFSFDEAKNTWTRRLYNDFEGFNFDSPLVPSSQLTSALSEDGQPVFRFGEILKSRKDTFCYLQILTMDDKSVLIENTKTDYYAPIRTFIKGCEQKSLPLILDLRLNPGGNIATPDALFTSLLPNEGVYNLGYTAARISPANAAMFLQVAWAPLVVPKVDWDDFVNSVRRGDPYSSPIFSSDVRANDGAGFNQPIVALISGECASACDMLAGLLKKSHRAILIGTPTSGTGLGRSSIWNADSEYRDKFNLFKFFIPNIVFGLLPGPGQQPGNLGWHESLQWSTENRPIEPDIVYEYGVEDIIGRGEPVLKRALEELARPLTEEPTTKLKP